MALALHDWLDVCESKSGGGEGDEFLADALEIKEAASEFVIFMMGCVVSNLSTVLRQMVPSCGHVIDLAILAENRGSWS